MFAFHVRNEKHCVMSFSVKKQKNKGFSLKKNKSKQNKNIYVLYQETRTKYLHSGSEKVTQLQMKICTGTNVTLTRETTLQLCKSNTDQHRRLWHFSLGFVGIPISNKMIMCDGNASGSASSSNMGIE